MQPPDDSSDFKAADPPDTLGQWSDLPGEVQLKLQLIRARHETVLQQKLMVLSQRDYPLDYVVLVMPEDLYRKCRVSNYRDKGKEIHRDLRLAFKAMAMQYHKPTQLLLETTTGLTDSRRYRGRTSRLAPLNEQLILDHATNPRL